MRITNKIMQNNSLRNINTNKELQDKLNTQMATGEKTTRPSDDPVIAIRSLRLSTNLTKLEQYNEKNAEDAGSWMSVTEDAIDAAEGVLQSIYKECERGVGDDMNTSNYRSILSTIKQLCDDFYCSGDAECAGQNLFTGYRTESKLTFQQDENKQYTITQNFTIRDINTRTHIETGDILKYTESMGFISDETDVQPEEYSRIRLAYDHLDVPVSATPGLPPTVPFYIGGAVENLIVMSSEDAGAYTPAANKAYLLADTGEIILGKDIVAAMSALPESTEFSLQYDKSVWTKGDLMPEHYFDCRVTKDDGYGNTITLDYASGSRQEIKYDLGYNQSIQVNTAADEVFTHGAGRDIEDMEILIGKLERLDDIVTSLEKKTETLSGTDLEDARLQLDAAKKAQDYYKDQVQKNFGSLMTSMQGYADQAHLALTTVGSKGARLELIQNRLSSQQSTFEELLVNNNHKEIEESTTELAGAKLTYDAALAATAKIMQTSLMNYI